MTDLYRIKELEWEDTTSGGFESGSYWIKHVKHSLAKNKYYLHRCGELISGYEFSVQAKAAANDHHRKEVGKMLTNTRTPSPTLRQIKSVEELEKKLRSIFQLGQAYWHQANHEFPSENKKAEKTLEAYQSIKAELLSTPDRQLLDKAADVFEELVLQVNSIPLEERDWSQHVYGAIQSAEETLGEIKHEIKNLEGSQELGEKE